MESVPIINFSSGEIIFKEGDLSNCVYLIKGGKVEISRQRSNAKKVVLATPGINSVFGEMALIDGQPRSATAIALETTSCYKCSSNGILNELQKIDQEIYETIQNFAAIIRENNNLKLYYNKDRAVLNAPYIISSKNIRRPYLTKEQVIANDSLNKKVETLSPFIKSMYRILMTKAYDN